MYNGHNDVTAIIDAGSNVKASYYYDTYNTAGNRETEKVVAGGVTTTTTYAYNAKGWLTSTSAVTGSVTNLYISRKLEGNK